MTHPRGRIQAPALPDPLPGEEILQIEGLRVEFRRGQARTQALRGVDLSLRAGRVLGVAGESGSGKTTAALAAMGLLPRGASVAGSVRYRGTDLLTLSERELRTYRGRHLAMIFQETSSALNPVMRIGDQLLMAARAHTAGSKAEARQRVIDALADVRLPDYERVMASYPHELSGGMCQRVIIAMALSCGSRVLFADEPTTALDVSVQEEILELIRGLVGKRQLAVMMISHDLAVLAEICDELAVMYRGEVVESGAVGDTLAKPAHPYTQALLDCLPRLDEQQDMLPELRPAEIGVGEAGECLFRPRCAFAVDKCHEAPPFAAVEAGRSARCWRSAELLGGAPGAAATPHDQHVDAANTLAGNHGRGN
jgi:peptide/nickel transport system ATP-binding protein